MRTHIENDIYIHGTLGYTIEKRVMRNVKDKSTGVVTSEEFFEVCGNYASLAGAVRGLLHHKVLSISDETMLNLTGLSELVQTHIDFIESKLGGIKA